MCQVGEFFRQSIQLVTYLKTITLSPNGYFPYEGASQNRVLWVHGKSSRGKTMIGKIIGRFIEVFRLPWTNEIYIPSSIDEVINKSFFYHLLLLEELTYQDKRSLGDFLTFLD